MLNHVEQRILGGDGQVLTLVCTVLANANAGRSVEPARNGHFRCGEVIVSEELQILYALLLGLALADPETQVNPGAHLDRRPAGLAVPLSIMDVAGRDQATLSIYGHQDGSAWRYLLNVYVPGGLTRRNGAQPFLRTSLILRHGIRRVRR